MKNRTIFTLSLIFLLFSPVTHSQSALSNDKIVELLRVQTDETAATALLKSINESIVYQDVFEMLDAGLIQNTDYPIPNELVNRVLSQFKLVEDYNMSQVIDDLSRANNEHFNIIDAIKEFINHQKIDSEGYLKAVRILNKQKNTMSVDDKKQLFAAVSDSKFGQDPSLLEASFKGEITATLLAFLMKDDEVIEDDLAPQFFDQLQKTDDDQIKGIVTGMHKGTIRYSNYQEALEHIAAFDNCLERCQLQLIQLITYNEDIELNNPDTILMKMAQRPDTTDHVLGELIVPTWDARRPLSDPDKLLAAIKSAPDYGPVAQQKMEQAARNLKEVKKDAKDGTI